MHNSACVPTWRRYSARPVSLASEDTLADADTETMPCNGSLHQTPSTVWVGGPTLAALLGHGGVCKLGRFWSNRNN